MSANNEQIDNCDSRNSEGKQDNESNSTSIATPLVAEDIPPHRNQEMEAFIETFAELGNRICSAHNVVKKARNIHKSVCDDINCALALYEKVRETIDLMLNLDNVIGLTNEAKTVLQMNATQVDTDGGIPTQPRSSKRRSRSKSPNRESQPKKLKTTGTPRNTQTSVSNGESTPKGVEANEWKMVKHRKEKRKKAKANYEQGEALTITSNTGATYADVIKEMKKNIDPREMGIDIKTMRRTKTGDILVKFNRGVGQAEKLSQAIGNTLGKNVKIKTVTRSLIVDIRDMDESTDEEEIRNALTTATNIEPTMIKILNIRESYANTKQALIQVPEHSAIQLFENGKIRIGWVMCRVRKKAKTIQCFRCLDQGHVANVCKGEDRSDMCRKCCNAGHKANDCKEKTRCVICQDAGLENFEHYIGSTFCINNRRSNRTHV